MRWWPRCLLAMVTFWPDYDSRKAQIADRRSAARWSEALPRPLLILHGSSDPHARPRL